MNPIDANEIKEEGYYWYQEKDGSPLEPVYVIYGPSSSCDGIKYSWGMYCIGGELGINLPNGKYWPMIPPLGEVLPPEMLR